MSQDTDAVDENCPICALGLNQAPPVIEALLETGDGREDIDELAAMRYLKREYDISVTLTETKRHLNRHIAIQQPENPDNTVIYNTNRSYATTDN